MEQDHGNQGRIPETRVSLPFFTRICINKAGCLSSDIRQLGSQSDFVGEMGGCTDCPMNQDLRLERFRYINVALRRDG